MMEENDSNIIYFQIGRISCEHVRMHVYEYMYMVDVTFLHLCRV